MDHNKEVVVYMNQPYKKYRRLGYVCLIQAGFTLVNFIMMPTPKLIEERKEALKNRVRKKAVENPEQMLDEYEPNPDYDPATVIQRFKRLSYKEIFSPMNIVDNVISRPWLSTAALASASLITFAIHVYCRRMAHIITLLPNDRIRFTSFSMFARGQPPSVEMPLRDVSCVQGRQTAGNYTILKLRNYYGYHLVQKQGGQFVEPELFDKHLGYARAWASPKS